MTFPKTVYGYLSKLKSLDDCVYNLKGFDSLTDNEKESLDEVRAKIAEAIDTFKKG